MGTGPFYPVQLAFGTLSSFRFQLLSSVLRMLLGLVVKWISFLTNLHWPVGDLDLGVGGVSYVELLILYELWAGERLSLEKAFPRYLRPGRQISVSAVPIGPGIGYLALVSVYWCYDAVSLHITLWVLVVSYLALLVLIIVGFVILVGRSVVMVSLLGRVRVLLCFS